jgi:hypothetical protein
MYYHPSRTYPNSATSNHSVNQSLRAFAWYSSVLRGESPEDYPPGQSPAEDELLQCGIDNGVIPLAHYHLAKASALQELPENLRTLFQQHSRQAAALEMARQHETQIVLQEFRSHHIDALLMKGTPLAYSLYAEPYLRVRCDSDVLFDSPESAESAWEILRQRGYQRPNAVSGKFISHEFACYRKTPAGIQHTFDLHWRVNNAQRFARALTFEELAATAAACPALGEAALGLGPVHALLLACMHRIAHKPEGCENRLIWLYDIHLLCGHLDDRQWREFVSLAQHKGQCGICLDGLQQVQQTLHTAIPAAVIETLAESVDAETTMKQWTSSLAKDLSNLRALPARQRLAFIRETLFPDASYMMTKYHTKHRALLPLLYLRRALQGLAKRL